MLEKEQFAIRFDFVKLSGCRSAFELRNQIRHCKTVCIKRNLCLKNYNRMRTQWTTKGNRDAGSFAHAIEDSTDIFGISVGLWTPKPPLRYTTGSVGVTLWKEVLLTVTLCAISCTSSKMQTGRHFPSAPWLTADVESPPLRAPSLHCQQSV